MCKHKKIRKVAQKRGKYPIIENLEIVDIAAEGKAIGKVNDMVVFVPLAIPGDVVNVQINSKRRRFMEGYILEMVKSSPLRTEPFCSHYGECGGCKWQALPYANQLEFKQKQVADQLQRIGGVTNCEVSPIIGSAATQYYRNKLEYTFSPKRWVPRSEVGNVDAAAGRNALGFHIPGMFDKILNIDHCYLQPEPSNAIRLAVKEFADNEGLTFYDIRSHEGLLRNLIIRDSTTGEVMVIVVFGYDDPEAREKLMSHIAAKFPEITSLNYIINEKLNDSVADQTAICYSGRQYIVEQMEGLKFRVGPKSFYQTNSAQAYELYKVTREAAGLTGNEVVYDLYTGTGTIAQFVASECRKVVGVEYVPEAIEDAKHNATLNGIDNCTFFAGDMKDVMNASFIAQNDKPDVIILDPPRAGVHEDVIRTILAAEPSKIVYVSCNPATQARDIALMAEMYEVTMIQPVDMFPHTHHVENVVLMVKK